MSTRIAADHTNVCPCGGGCRQDYLHEAKEDVLAAAIYWMQGVEGGRGGELGARRLRRAVTMLTLTDLAYARRLGERGRRLPV